MLDVSVCEPQGFSVAHFDLLQRRLDGAAASFVFAIGSALPLL